MKYRNYRLVLSIYGDLLTVVQGDLFLICIFFAGRWEGRFWRGVEGFMAEHIRSGKTHKF